MTGNSILLTHPDFEQIPTENCQLLLKLGLDSFSYAIVNDNNQVLCLYDEQECEDVAQLFAQKQQSDPLLAKNYSKTLIALQTTNLLHVPNVLYNGNASTQVKYFNHDDFGTVYTTEGEDTTTVFAPNYALDRILTQHFTSAKVTEAAQGLLALATHESNCVYLDFSVQCFTAVLVKEGKLVFQNTFEISNTEELNYFLLLLINQLKLNDTTKVLVSGVIDNQDDKYAVIGKLFSNTQFNEINFLHTEILEDLPSHYYTSLLAQILCA